MRLTPYCFIAAALLAPVAAHAQTTSVSIGYSGWTGFGPLTLAKEAGIYEKHGLDVSLEKIPQASRNLALASGDIQCAATTVETWVIWNANGVPAKQLFQLDKSYGADGIVVRDDINEVADLKGKSIAASAPGTSPYFFLAYILDQNGLTMDDVTVVNMEPGPAAQAFIAGQNDAAMTYEPYLSSVRDAPDAGKILATTLDYPAVLDTFGCTPDFIEHNPEAVKALADSYFEALDMIASDKDKAYEIMGADVNQTGEEFGASAEYLRWQDREAAKSFFDGEYLDFAKAAGELLVSMGLIKEAPDPASIVDTSFVQ
ncbi:ABC transporter substrate-binding protein [Consotaella aegiceratis]|uniref:ABC transporter substrate-binding protein n=1 Tax=Consotaella aegiceratis TaxID=3097961 RepID=UPI002F4084FF